MLLLSIALAATLSRAEILDRFKSPVITQAEGLVQVYADCPQDMRREYQMPIAGFAADTVRTLYGGLQMKPQRFQRPGIVIHIGEVRTNLAMVVAKVVTNDARVVTRIYLESPGYADLKRFRLELIKGFFRCVKQREVTTAEAIDAYRDADPELRILDMRMQVEDYMDKGLGSFEDGTRLMRKIIEPGHASRRDVLIFSSRLYLYPPLNSLRFAGKYDGLDFREAILVVRQDPNVRLVALRKADELPLFGGGRGDSLQSAALAYREFLLALAKNEDGPEAMGKLLDAADLKLKQAYAEAEKFDRRAN